MAALEYACWALTMSKFMPAALHPTFQLLRKIYMKIKRWENKEIYSPPHFSLRFYYAAATLAQNLNNLGITSSACLRLHFQLVNSNWLEKIRRYN